MVKSSLGKAVFFASSFYFFPCEISCFVCLNSFVWFVCGLKGGQGCTLRRWLSQCPVGLVWGKVLFWKRTMLRRFLKMQSWDCCNDHWICIPRQDFHSWKCFVPVFHLIYLHSCDLFSSEGLQMPCTFIDQIMIWDRGEWTLGGQGWTLGHEQDGSGPGNSVKTHSLSGLVPKLPLTFRWWFCNFA